MCDCRVDVDKKLAAHNARIATGFTIHENTMGLLAPMIVLEKIDDRKRGRIPAMVATCCPFCGERYAKNDGVAA